jgi:glutathione peroxidase-family protein
MKRVFISVFILLLAVSLTAQAKIKFEQTEVDFGELESGKSTNLEFKFENAGNEMLIIKNVATSCGCTAAKLEKKEYKPGEKGVLPVTFYSQGYNGKIVKVITVASNDKENVYTRLKVKGTVKLTNFAAVELGSDRVDFKEVVIGKQYDETITLKNTGTIALRIIEVTHSPDVYPVFEKKSLDPNEETRVKIIFNPMETGRFATFVKIRSNAYRQRLVIVKVNAEVK